MIAFHVHLSLSLVERDHRQIQDFVCSARSAPIDGRNTSCGPAKQGVLLISCETAKEPSQKTELSHMGSGSDLLSRAVTSQVPSALKGLTAVFGMGTGGSPSPSPPEFLQMRLRTLKTVQRIRIQKLNLTFPSTSSIFTSLYENQ